VNSQANSQSTDIKMTIAYVVVVGHFNPAIIHPEWFRRFKLLPEEEIAASQTEHVVSQPAPGLQMIEGPMTTVTPFRTEISFTSYHLLVTPDRFQLSATKENSFFQLPILAIKIFSLLSHTPTRAVGFNFEAHWGLQESEMTVLRRIFCANEDKISAIFGEDYEIGGKLAFNKNDCRITLRLERSVQLNGAVYINFNFHRDISSQEAEVLIDIIRSNFNNDLQQAKTIAVTLLGEPTSVWRLQ
jgi:hypothetical protein